MADAPMPSEDRGGPEERDSREPAPRWIWMAAVPGFYFASYLAAVALDRFGHIPPSLYPPLKMIFFPFEFLVESSRLFRDVIEAFTNFIKR